MIDELKKGSVSVQRTCRLSDVSASGYYAWKKRPASGRRQENEALQAKILHCHQESRGTYGEPRLRAKLKSEGFSYGKNRVVRLMKAAGLSGLSQRRFQVKTTEEGWLFLAIILDVFSRKIVGYAMADHMASTASEGLPMRAELVLDALNHALLGQNLRG
jgi:putative transposase